MRGGTNWRSIIAAPEGHWAFWFLELQALDASWVNLSDLGVGDRTVEFPNAYDLEDDIDRNTHTFSATLRGSVGAFSLMPFRTDSPLNASGGTYQPLVDLHIPWRLWVCFTPRGTLPEGPEDYRERARGIIDRIDLSFARDEIRLQGRGPEADLIDHLIIADEVTPKVYAAGPVADVLQAMLDDQFPGQYTLVVDGSAPSTFIDEIRYTEPVGFWKLFSDTAAVGTGVVRFLYDDSDNLDIHLFTPNRSATVPQWSVGPNEYGDLDNGLDLQTVANYIVVRFVNASGAIETVTSPATPVSASITRYAQKSVVITLAQNSGVNDATRAQALADAIRSDRELPILGQVVTGSGLWFGELWDFVGTPANPVLYNEDQAGGVVGWHESGRNSVIDNVFTLQGKPKGRFATWLEISSPTAPTAADISPALTSYDASYWETYSGGVLTAGGVGDMGTVNAFTNSVAIEVGTDPTFATVEFIEYTDVTPGGDFRHQWEGASRATPYYFRATPWTGPLVAGVPTGVAGAVSLARAFSGPTPTDSPTFAWDTSDPQQLRGDVIGLTGSDPDTIGGSIASVSQVDFINAGSDAEVLEDIPAAATEIVRADGVTSWRRAAMLVGVGAFRIVGYVTEETAGDEKIRVGYSTDGTTFTDLATPELPLSVAGVVRSDWEPAPSGMAADVDLRPLTIGGDDTQTAKLSSLAVQYSVTTRAGGGTSTGGGGGGGGGCGVVLATAWDDNFDCGTVIDTTGARFTGANAWTEYGISFPYTGAVIVSDELVMSMSSNGLWNPAGADQALPAGSGDWTFETDCSLSGAGFAPAVGLRLTETATGKDFHAAFSDVFGFLAVAGDGSSMGAYGADSVGALSGKLELARISGNLRVRYDVGSGWVTLVSGLAQTTPFTTAPDRVGVFHAVRRNGGGDVSYHEYFHRTV